MTNAEKLLSYFKKMSEEDKKEFAKIVRPYWPDFQIPDYVNPQTKKEDIKEL